MSESFTPDVLEEGEVTEEKPKTINKLLSDRLDPSNWPRIDVKSLFTYEIADELMKAANANVAENSQTEKLDLAEAYLTDNWREIHKKLVTEESPILSNNTHLMVAGVPISDRANDLIAQLHTDRSTLVDDAMLVNLAIAVFMKGLSAEMNETEFYGDRGLTKIELLQKFKDFFGIDMPENLVNTFCSFISNDADIPYIRDFAKGWLAGRDLLDISSCWDFEDNLSGNDCEPDPEIWGMHWERYRSAAVYLLELLYETSKDTIVYKKVRKLKEQLEKLEERLANTPDPKSVKYLKNSIKTIHFKLVKAKEFADECENDPLFAAYHYLLDKYMPEAKEFFPHPDDLQTLRAEFGDLINGALDFGVEDPMIITHRDEHPLFKFKRIAVVLQNTIRDTHPIDKKSWARQRICMALLDLMYDYNVTSSQFDERKKLRLTLGRDRLIEKLIAAGCTVIDENENGVTRLGYNLVLSNNVVVPIVAEVAPNKSEKSSIRKGKVRGTQFTELMDLSRMRDAILWDKISGGDFDKDEIFTALTAFKMKLFGDSIPDNYKKSSKGTISSGFNQYSSKFEAAKLFVKIFARRFAEVLYNIDDDKEEVIQSGEDYVGPVESQMGTFNDDHDVYVLRQLCDHRDHLGILSYKKQLIDLVDYIYLHMPKNKSEWDDLSTKSQHPSGHSYIRMVKILFDTFLNPEAHHFRMMTGVEYLPMMIDSPDMHPRLMGILGMVRDNSELFTKAMYDPAKDALDLYNLLVLMHDKNKFRRQRSKSDITKFELDQMDSRVAENTRKIDETREILLQRQVKPHI